MLQTTYTRYFWIYLHPEVIVAAIGVLAHEAGVSGVRASNNDEVVSPSSPKKSPLPCLVTNLSIEVST
jgi:hypothetical protein